MKNKTQLKDKGKRVTHVLKVPGFRDNDRRKEIYFLWDALRVICRDWILFQFICIDAPIKNGIFIGWLLTMKDIKWSICW